MHGLKGFGIVAFERFLPFYGGDTEATELGSGNNRKRIGNERQYVSRIIPFVFAH